jgi:ribosome-associated toxin RatA of RatAB toxin-antitoxin module
MRHLENIIMIKQRIDTVFKLSEDIEKFPAFMPHIKKSISKKKEGNKKNVEMSAIINGIKSSWASVSTTKKNKSIKYEQLKGVCEVMRGKWLFEEVSEGTKILIIHDFDLGWPIIGKLLSRTILKNWVDKYCRLTLAAIKEKAELHK